MGDEHTTPISNTPAPAGEAAPERSTEEVSVAQVPVSSIHEEISVPNEQGREAGSEEDTSHMKWYVVQAYSGYETKVMASLEERIKQAGMTKSFGQILIPKENIQDARGGAKKLTTRTFYPGYIFVQMELNDKTWYLVKDTPRVSGFVGGRYPAPVPASEINAIAQQVAEGQAKPKPRVVFEAGDHVRVVDGAFANFTGSIEEVKTDKQKVRVLLSIFGRATPVELDYIQVEKTV